MTTVADRLAEVEGLDAQRVHGAAKLSDALKRGVLVQAAPAAFLLPLGIRGGAADAMTGLYRQPIERYLGILLVARAADDVTGAKAFGKLEPMIEDVIGRIAGWGPGNAVDGVYRLAKGELVSLDAGTLQYQLDFILDDQLRIAP